MKEKEKYAHMRAAHVYADLSYCERKQVGCLIVKNGTPIAIGYNGTPSGEENVCEGEDGLTKPNVIHAEDNALRKLTRSNENSIGADVFITASPCIRCAEKLADARVAKVYYAEIYSHHVEGIEYLEKHGIKTELLKEE